LRFRLDALSGGKCSLRPGLYQHCPKVNITAGVDRSPGAHGRGGDPGTIEAVFPTGSNDVYVCRGGEKRDPASRHFRGGPEDRYSKGLIDGQTAERSVDWKKMIFDILTLFPEMFQSPLDSSLLKKAREKGADPGPSAQHPRLRPRQAQGDGRLSLRRRCGDWS